ncbi:F0F1 ATP synthase subunit delta [Microbulbifer magnicolonia]|uniref:F0F1 ATP synthase subunit delta n=1 Tax=Microbulbifer magnicolonia TaxID=3109744 RepID=UPI002B401BB1|nr:F0F1 ATP synthase subunit delta [Microbulbifer sp. GG15]
MELSWSTFLLEIVNFLVLVWILKRFFYKPLQSVIARRQQNVETQLAEAAQTRQQAVELQQQYEARLDEWQRERRSAHEDLQRELRAERARGEKDLQETLQQQRQKAETVERRRQSELQRQLERQALEQGGQFAARLLQQGSGPELQQRLLELLLHSMSALSEERLQALRQSIAEAGMAEAGKVAEITSAFPLTQPQRRQLQHTVREILHRDLTCHFVEDPELLAGLRIAVGPWQLGASVRDELQAFARLAGAAE